MSKNVHVLHAAFQHVDKDGNVIWEQDFTPNILHDGGEQYILAQAFASGMTTYGTRASSLYLGLDARATVAEADTLTNLSGEPSGNGYARQALVTTGTGASGQDFYINQPAAYYRADSKTVTFSCNTSAWTGVTRLFLTNASSGTTGILLCTVDLSATRTLQPGDSLNASIYVGLSE